MRPESGLHWDGGRGGPRRESTQVGCGEHLRVVTISHTLQTVYRPSRRTDFTSYTQTLSVQRDTVGLLRLSLFLSSLEVFGTYSASTQNTPWVSNHPFLPRLCKSVPIHGTRRQGLGHRPPTSQTPPGEGVVRKTGRRPPEVQ